MTSRTTTIARSVGAIAGTALLATGLITAFGGTSNAAGGVATPAAAQAGETGVPAALALPAGQRLVADFTAKGVQVYQCSAGAWAFLEPAATLHGWSTRPFHPQAAVHFRGPSWESIDDGSLVEGKAIATSRVDGSIPELLLEATKNRGDGVFGKVSYVQRLATSGGAAPTTPCADGQTKGVPYHARYRFYAPQPTS